MKAVKAAWSWFTARWTASSTPLRVLLAILLPIGAVAVVGIAIPYELIARLDGSRRLPEAARWGVAVVAFLVVVGLIAAASDGAQVATDAGASATPTSLAALETELPSSAAQPSTDLQDDIGDLIDADGERARGPAYVDITMVAAQLDDGDLTVRIEVAETPPTVDPLTAEVSYGYLLDVDGDNEPDFQVLVSNIEEGGSFSGSISRLTDGDTRAGDDFPGIATINANLVLVQLPLDQVDGPSSVQLAAFAEWIFYPDPNEDPTRFDMVTDEAPDAIWPDEPAHWIELP